MRKYDTLLMHSRVDTHSCALGLARLATAVHERGGVSRRKPLNYVR